VHNTKLIAIQGKIRIFKHRPSQIFGRSTFASSKLSQNVYSRPNRCLNRRYTGDKTDFSNTSRPSQVMSRQSCPSWKSRDLITSSEITVCTTDHSRNYLPYGHYAYTLMRIVYHVYFGWESKLGSPISRESRDGFAVAQIRHRLPLDVCLYQVV
jgi:hypothetical protein